LPLDPNSLPKDAATLKKIVVDLAEQLDRVAGERDRESSEKNKYAEMIRELLEAQRARKSEKLSVEQSGLFEQLWRKVHPAEASEDIAAAALPETPSLPEKKRAARQPLARHVTRERIVHDLPEAEKHCGCCGRDLRLIAEETSERYEYMPAALKVIEDVRRRYACECTVKAAEKPAQPIEKSTAGASLLAHIIVAKWADHQPLHRQQQMLARHGVEISRKTMGGWLAQCAGLLEALYGAAKKELFSSHCIGTDDTGVKVLDRKLPFARTGRIWPYVGDARHPVVVYDYTPTRARAGPAKFLEGYKGCLQADAYSVYDAFFKQGRGLIEVGCWMHARRYFYKALETDEARMGPALHLIARLYRVEDRARALALPPEKRLELRRSVSAPVMEKLHAYLLQIKQQILPNSSSGAAVRYAINQCKALNAYLEDGELEIDNGATERANRDIAVGRGNWTFFGSDAGGRTAAILRTFIASCKRNGVEPFAWFRDVLSRIPARSIIRLW
jgi:transposase